MSSATTALQRSSQPPPPPHPSSSSNHCRCAMSLDDDVPSSYSLTLRRRRQAVSMLALMIVIIYMSNISLAVEASTSRAAANDDTAATRLDRHYLQRDVKMLMNGRRRINAESIEQEADQGPDDERGNDGKDGQDDDKINDRAEPSPSNKNAHRQLSAFFDNVLKLQDEYGTDVVTVRDAATEAYPILSESYDVTMGDCPFSYLPWQRSEDTGYSAREGEYFAAKEPPQRPRPCFTPIVTIHDRIANSWGPPGKQQQYNAELPEVLLLSGLENSPRDFDALGPSSIYQTLRLLLECARCESLSPWVKNNTNTNPRGADATKDGIFRAPDPAKECRLDLLNRQSIDDSKRRWLARLVATRRIVAMPIVDVAGFYEHLLTLWDGQDNKEQVKEDDLHQQKDDDQSSWAECDFPFPFNWKSFGNGDKQFTATATCMSTFPARVMNELFRSHAFQLGVAFHGSTNIKEYESSWVEVPSWKSDDNNALISFDEVAMTSIAQAYGKFAFPVWDKSNSSPYSYQIKQVSASINNLDGCRGAKMEHFAFAAGFIEGGSGVNGEGSLWMEQCQCAESHKDSNEDNNGNAHDDVCAYPTEQTRVYDGSSLRAFVVGIVNPSTPDPAILDKSPGFVPLVNPLLGHPDSIYKSLVGKYIHTSLLATELVEPYTAIRSIGGVELRDDDVVPMSPRPHGSCMRTRSMIIPESAALADTSVTWAVGGALSVAETAIMYARWDVLDKKIFDCVTQPTKQELDAFFTILRDFEVMEGETAEEMAEDVNFTPIQSGVTRWHGTAASDEVSKYDGGVHHENGDASSAGTMHPAETTFSVSLDLSHYKVGDVIAIYSLARTDQDWVSGGNGGGDSAGLVPTAHSNIVNARTNPQWSHVHANSMDGGSLIKGHLDWFSVPVTIKIGPQPGFFEGNEPIETSVRISDSESMEESQLGLIAYALFMAVLVLAITVVCVFCREERDGTDMCSIWSEHRRIDRQRIKMDDFFHKEELELTRKMNSTI